MRATGRSDSAPDRPFAHKGLTTVGMGFYVEVAGDWEDASLRGRLAFQRMVDPLIKPVTFNNSDMASIWRPHEGVWLNAAVQAGTPCVEGARVPTQLLAVLLGPEASYEGDLLEVCADDQFATEQVRAAI